MGSWKACACSPARRPRAGRPPRPPRRGGAGCFFQMGGAVGVLGGPVRAWMGGGCAGAAWRNRLDPPAGAAGRSAGRSLVRAGLLTTVANPYWLLWWATVGAAHFVRFPRFGPLAVAGLFFIGHISLDLGWNSFLALVVGAGRGKIPARAFRVVLGGCGGFLIGMSLYFVYFGVYFLTR